MPRRPSPALTDAELSIMRVLWTRRRATVGEVVEALERSPKPAYNTVLTTLGILEEKGFVTHEKAGRAFAYEPLVGEQEARRTALSHLLARFFDNSPERLVLNLLGRDEATPEELDRLRALIDGAQPPRPRSRGRR